MSNFVKEARTTFALALPISFGSASQMLMGVIDSVMIGGSGAVPLAASSVGNNIYNFFYIVGIGLLLPAAVMISHARGAAKESDCASWLRHGFFLALAAGSLGCLAMFLLSAKLELLGQPPEVIAVVIPFFLLIAVSMIPSLLFLVLRQYSESLGMPWLPMSVMMGCVALNTGLNWVLIYGNLGCPALGLTGAGISTLSARIAAVGLLLWFLERRLKGQEAWPWSGMSLYKIFSFSGLELAKLRDLVRLGLPSAGQLLFELCAFTSASLMMGWLGTQSLAAHQIALSCVSFTFMFPLGLSTAASMRIGKALGENHGELVRNIGLGSFAMTWLIMGSFAVLFAVGGRQIALVYVNDAEVVALATRLLVVAAIFQLFDGTQIVGTGALRGMLDIKTPTAITGVAYCGIAVPLSYFLGVRCESALGIWVGLAGGLACAAIPLFWRFHLMTRKLLPPKSSQS